MVPITSALPENFDRIETNLKYLIDLDLSDDEIFKDSLSLALYYHIIEKNNLQNVNTLATISWARTFCFEKIVQGKLSRKRDSEITAAILAYATLQKDRGYPEDKKKEIEGKIKEIIKNEKDKEGLLFGRPNFTAIILYAIHQEGITTKEEEGTLDAVLLRYKGDSQTFNNLLGLPFLVQLLINLREDKELENLIANIKERMDDQLLDYDDKAYLVSALWAYHEKKDTLSEIQKVAELTIEETPIMVSDIINKGDISDITVRQDNLKISRLYKALFLDMLTSYKRRIASLKEKELDKRFSGDFNLRWGAFATFSVIPIIITAIVGYGSSQNLKAGISFWILQQTKTTWEALAVNTFSLILISYLMVFSILGTYSLHLTIIRKRLARDLRVWHYYKRHQLKGLKWFAITLLGACILGIVTQLGGNAFQDFIRK
jgi:hypothetical protein